MFEAFAEGKSMQFWPCPACKTPSEKISGCNKMTCGKCKVSFCWVCKEVIKDKNPYDHFNKGNDQDRNSRFYELKRHFNDISSFKLTIKKVCTTYSDDFGLGNYPWRMFFFNLFLLIISPLYTFGWFTHIVYRGNERRMERMRNDYELEFIFKSGRE